MNTPTNNNSNEFELEKHLHEQYAINNNAKVSSFVTFVIALLALFGFYGYSFVYSVNSFHCNTVSNNIFIPLDAFLLFSVIVVGILYFLALVSIQFGYTNRSDQVIIDKIRDKRFGKDKNYIFHENYSPTDKTWNSFIPDFFSNFYWLFLAGQITVFLLTFYKISKTNCIGNTQLFCWLIFVIIVLTFHLMFIFLTILCRYHYFKKYCSIFRNYSKVKSIV